MSNENSTEFVDVYTLILINFLTFCQSINLTDIKLKGSKRDETYIYLICKLFNIYVSDVRLWNFDFVVPEFFDKEKFKINRELITNKWTRETIEAIRQARKYIFKVILSSFNKEEKKTNLCVFTDNTVILFNNFIDSINLHIDTYLNKMREVSVKKFQPIGIFPTFFP